LETAKDKGCSMNPIHPRNITNMMTLYTAAGEEMTTYSVLFRDGKYMWSVTGIIDGVKEFINYEYDLHDYDGTGGDPLPELYKKNPRRKK